MFRNISLAILVLSAYVCFGQGDPYYINAFRFSQSQVHGSARTLGFAGAQTALGADLGSLTSNPAGLGFYRKSEFSFAPVFSIVKTNSGTPGFNTPDNKVVLNLNNLGVSFCGLRDDLVESKWRGGIFSIGVTRTAHFQNSSTYRGTNTNSFSDYITNRANSEGFDWTQYNKNNVQNLLDMAYGAYLFSPEMDTTNSGVDGYSTSRYLSLLPNEENNGLTYFQKQETIDERGGMNEWTAAYGGNYNNKFFFGGSISLAKLRYQRTNSYHEYALNNLNAPNITTDIVLNETLKVSGTGVNIALGANYVINDVIRVGASVKSPTYMSLKETYNASMSARYANVTLLGQPNAANKSTNTAENKYTLTSPLILSGGAAVFLGKMGFITGDVEYLDYTSSYIGGKDKTLYITSNEYTKLIYKDVVNIRLGAEIRADIMRFRVGYALLGSPWKSDVPEYDRRVRTDDMGVLTMGIGVRTNQFFMDLAYNRSSYNSDYTPYINPNVSDDLQIKTSNALNNLTLGGGVFF